MLLKYTFYGLSTLAVLASGKRKSGRRHFKRHQAHMANQKYDPNAMIEIDEPGAENLWEYLQSGEFEDFTADWYQDAQKMGMIADDDREAGDGYSEAGFRSFSLEDLINAGGLPYCRAIKKMLDGNKPEDINQLASPSSNSNYGIVYNAVQNSNALTDYQDMKRHCKDMNKKMNRRKRACTTFLMYVTYNPRYPNLVGPITEKQKTKAKYCKKITKLRNPWRYCQATCPLNTPGVNHVRCTMRRRNCNKVLDEFWRNTNPKTGRWQDRAGIPCRDLPKQFKSAPPSDHPVNNQLRCGPVVCDWIPGSERPWCAA